MTPEALAAKLGAIPEIGLRSVILYGSAAAGDHVPGRSDYNVLVVAERLGAAELERLVAPTREWIRAGNRPPLLFTPERLRGSADVFPIELLDMRDRHRVLAGEDALAAIEVGAENLRLQVEHELKGKLVALREEYLRAGGEPGALATLMVGSLSTFQVLLRAALRLFQPEVPAAKREAVQALARRIGFDAAVFDEVQGWKEGQAPPQAAAARAAFGRYLAAVEAAVDAVDAHLRGTRNEGGRT